jgi:hypothetical protein
VLSSPVGINNTRAEWLVPASKGTDVIVQESIMASLKQATIVPIVHDYRDEQLSDLRSLVVPLSRLRFTSRSSMPCVANSPKEGARARRRSS